MEDKQILRTKIRWHQDLTVLFKLIAARFSKRATGLLPLQNRFQYGTETAERGYIEL